MYSRDIYLSRQDNMIVCRSLETLWNFETFSQFDICTWFSNTGYIADIYMYNIVSRYFVCNRQAQQSNAIDATLFEIFADLGVFFFFFLFLQSFFSWNLISVVFLVVLVFIYRLDKGIHFAWVSRILECICCLFFTFMLNPEYRRTQKKPLKPDASDGVIS